MSVGRKRPLSQKVTSDSTMVSIAFRVALNRCASVIKIRIFEKNNFFRSVKICIFRAKIRASNIKSVYLEHVNSDGEVHLCIVTLRGVLRRRLSAGWWELERGMRDL